MTALLKIYTDTAPGSFWAAARSLGNRSWKSRGSPEGRLAEFEARAERKLRARLARATSTPRATCGG